MTAHIVRVLAVDRLEADRLRANYTQRYGATLLGLVRAPDFDAHAFLREVHPAGAALAALTALGQVERGLRTLLQTLPGRRLLLTNGSTRYAHEILAALGLAQVFERVIAIEDMQNGKRWHAKPDAIVLRRILRRERIAPAQAVLVEDTRTHLKRYRRLGVRTVWMTGHLRRGNASKIRATGRPSYVDFHARSIARLARWARGGFGPRGVSR